MRLIENYNIIKKKIQNANSHSNVELIVISKNQQTPKISYLIEKTQHVHFGENKLQEAIVKWPDLKTKYKNIKLHFIGRLQSNKVKDVVKHFDYIHSIDSLTLAAKCSQEEKKIDKMLSYFIQINFDDEPQKSGINFNKASDLFIHCKENLQLNIIGLMCIPPVHKDPEIYFKKIKLLADDLKIKDLSMGMSNDYESAIQNGSTFVRIGSKIFCED